MLPTLRASLRWREPRAESDIISVMTDIQFQDEQMYGRPVAAKEKGLTALVQKWGLAKDGKQAEYILLGMATTLIIITLAVWLLAMPRGSSISEQQYLERAAHPQHLP